MQKDYTPITNDWGYDGDSTPKYGGFSTNIEPNALVTNSFLHPTIREDLLPFKLTIYISTRVL